MLLMLDDGGRGLEEAVLEGGDVGLVLGGQGGSAREGEKASGCGVSG